MISSFLVASVLCSTATETTAVDVAVYGDTPCGIAAALSAARHGRSVALIGDGPHAGGLMTSGLSITDVRFRAAHGGIFREFITRVAKHYREKYGPESAQYEACNGGLWFEPHVAQRIFEVVLAEQPGIVLLRNKALDGVLAEDGRVTGLVLRGEDGRARRLLAKVTIDAGYEGDVAAAAGVPYRVGREARDEFHEPYAGHGFLKNPGLQMLPGGTGEGDQRIQAYNFRLIMTDRPDLRVPIRRPDCYDRSEYAPLVPLAHDGSIRGIRDVIRLAPIPNGKFNANNRPIVRSLDLPEANTDWPEGTPERRREIYQRYADYTLGLLWFLQHDPELPEAFRRDALEWGLCADEFADNDHLPYRMYVREARRIVGRKTFTAHDAFLAPSAERTPIHSDSVAIADYHVDSHIVQRQQPGWPHIEGHVYLRLISKPAHVPFGVMLPEETKGLLVPGAVSATHLGFSVLRMEPVWVALGQAAGTAAAMSVEQQIDAADLPVLRIQRTLLDNGQMISFFYDIPGPDPIWVMQNIPEERARLDLLPETPAEDYCPGIQLLATRGYFTTYFARPNDPVTRSEAARWLHRLAVELDALDADGPVRPFADVPEGHPDHRIVRSLRAAGLVTCWPGTEGFFPGAALSRAEAADWIARLARRAGLIMPVYPATLWPWKDLDPTGDVSGPVGILWHNRWLPDEWVRSDEFQPHYYVSRREYCAMLARMLQPEGFAGWINPDDPRHRNFHRDN